MLQSGMKSCSPKTLSKRFNKQMRGRWKAEPSVPRGRYDLLCANTMTLEQLGNLGELIGFIGVIMSLVYLGRQIQ